MVEIVQIQKRANTATSSQNSLLGRGANQKLLWVMVGGGWVVHQAFSMSGLSYLINSFTERGRLTIPICTKLTRTFYSNQSTLLKLVIQTFNVKTIIPLFQF